MGLINSILTAGGQVVGAVTGAVTGTAQQVGSIIARPAVQVVQAVKQVTAPVVTQVNSYANQVNRSVAPAVRTVQNVQRVTQVATNPIGGLASYAGSTAARVVPQYVNRANQYVAPAVQTIRRVAPVTLAAANPIGGVARVVGSTAARVVAPAIQRTANTIAGVSNSFIRNPVQVIAPAVQTIKRVAPIALVVTNPGVGASILANKTVGVAVSRAAAPFVQKTAQNLSVVSNAFIRQPVQMLSQAGPAIQRSLPIVQAVTNPTLGIGLVAKQAIQKAIPPVKQGIINTQRQVGSSLIKAGVNITPKQAGTVIQGVQDYAMRNPFLMNVNFIAAAAPGVAKLATGAIQEQSARVNAFVKNPVAVARQALPGNVARAVVTGMPVFGPTLKNAATIASVFDFSAKPASAGETRLSTAEGRVKSLDSQSKGLFSNITAAKDEYTAREGQYRAAGLFDSAGRVDTSTPAGQNAFSDLSVRSSAITGQITQLAGVNSKLEAANTEQTAAFASRKTEMTGQEEDRKYSTILGILPLSPAATALNRGFDQIVPSFSQIADPKKWLPGSRSEGSKAAVSQMGLSNDQLKASRENDVGYQFRAGMWDESKKNMFDLAAMAAIPVGIKVGGGVAVRGVETLASRPGVIGKVGAVVERFSPPIAKIGGAAMTVGYGVDIWSRVTGQSEGADRPAGAMANRAGAIFGSEILPLGAGGLFTRRLVVPEFARPEVMGILGQTRMKIAAKVASATLPKGERTVYRESTNLGLIMNGMKPAETRPLNLRAITEIGPELEKPFLNVFSRHPDAVVIGGASMRSQIPIMGRQQGVGTLRATHDVDVYTPNADRFANDLFAEIGPNRGIFLKEIKLVRGSGSTVVDTHFNPSGYPVREGTRQPLVQYVKPETGPQAQSSRRFTDWLLGDSLPSEIPTRSQVLFSGRDVQGVVGYERLDMGGIRKSSATGKNVSDKDRGYRLPKDLYDQVNIFRELSSAERARQPSMSTTDRIASEARIKSGERSVDRIMAQKVNYIDDREVQRTELMSDAYARYQDEVIQRANTIPGFFQNVKEVPGQSQFQGPILQPSDAGTILRRQHGIDGPNLFNDYGSRSTLQRPLNVVKEPKTIPRREPSSKPITVNIIETPRPHQSPTTVPALPSVFGNISGFSVVGVPSRIGSPSASLMVFPSISSGNPSSERRSISRSPSGSLISIPSSLSPRAQQSSRPSSSRSSSQSPGRQSSLNPSSRPSSRTSPRSSPGILLSPSPIGSPSFSRIGSMAGLSSSLRSPSPKSPSPSSKRSPAMSPSPSPGSPLKQMYSFSPSPTPGSPYTERYSSSLSSSPGVPYPQMLSPSYNSPSPGIAYPPSLTLPPSVPSTIIILPPTSQEVSGPPQPPLWTPVINPPRNPDLPFPNLEGNGGYRRGGRYAYDFTELTAIKDPDAIFKAAGKKGKRVQKQTLVSLSPKKLSTTRRSKKGIFGKWPVASKRRK